MWSTIYKCCEKLSAPLKHKYLTPTYFCWAFINRSPFLVKVFRLFLCYCDKITNPLLFPQNFSRMWKTEELQATTSALKKKTQYFKLIWNFFHFVKMNTLICNANQRIGFYITTTLGWNWSTLLNHLIAKFVISKSKEQRFLKINNNWSVTRPWIIYCCEAMVT